MSNRAALIAAFIYAVLPNFVFFSPVLASEHPFVILVLSAFLIATSRRLRPTVRFLTAGLLVGAATLTRGDGLMYGLIVLGWGIFTVERSGPYVMGRHVTVKVAGLFSLGILLVLTPWLVRNEVVVGRGTMLGGNSAIAFYYAHNPAGVTGGSDPLLANLSEAERQRTAWRLSFEYIRDNPGSLVKSARQSTSSVFRPNSQIYGVNWSTRERADGTYPYPTRPDLTRAFRVGRGLSVAGAWFLTIVPLLALLNPAAAGKRMLLLVATVVAANWVFYCVVFLGTPRYRFMPDVFLCLAAASVVTLVWRSPRLEVADVDPLSDDPTPTVSPGGGFTFTTPNDPLERRTGLRTA
jgi:4-amino-4-deoxy-L-arabinose transferase-like glycosyltransferase